MRVGIFGGGPEAGPVIEELRAALEAAGHQVVDPAGDPELICVVGGDGTFLRAVRSLGYPEVPFVGLNTGHLGFFQELGPGDTHRLANALGRPPAAVEAYALVEASIAGQDRTCWAVNECVLKAGNGKTLHLRVKVGDTRLMRFAGDGFIVATPLGSTAYNCAAGGAILHPSLPALVVTPLAPLNTTAYRSLTQGFVVPHTLGVEFWVEPGTHAEPVLVADGEEHPVPKGVPVRFGRASYQVRFWRVDARETFWDRIRTRFLGDAGDW